MSYPAIHLNRASFHKNDSAGAQSRFQTQNISNAIGESLLGTEMSLVPKYLWYRNVSGTEMSTYRNVSSTEMSTYRNVSGTEMSQGPKCPRTEMSLVPKCLRTEMSLVPKCLVPKCRYRNVPCRNVSYRNSRQPKFPISLYHSNL